MNLRHPSPSPIVATIGFFDGVHRGHRFLIDSVKQAARHRNMPAAVITFVQHPREVVQKNFCPRLLSTPEEKFTLLENTGIDRCILLHFDAEMAQLPARQFMKTLLKERFGVAELVIGYDNKFGHNRQENFADYRQYGEELNIHVTEAQRFAPQGTAISSSAIRHLLQNGHITAVNQALGYAYTLSGKVMPGFREGRKMGFPTANMQVENPQKLLPYKGVYATIVSIEGIEGMFPGMTNIGNRPTFGGKSTTVETHILGLETDIYHRRIHVSFMHRIRNEEHFTSVDALKSKIETDKKTATEMLTDNKLAPIPCFAIATAKQMPPIHHLSAPPID